MCMPHFRYILFSSSQGANLVQFWHFVSGQWHFSFLGTVFNFSTDGAVWNSAQKVLCSLFFNLPSRLGRCWFWCFRQGRTLEPLRISLLVILKICLQFSHKFFVRCSQKMVGIPWLIHFSYLPSPSRRSFETFSALHQCGSSLNLSTRFGNFSSVATFHRSGDLLNVLRLSARVDFFFPLSICALPE